MSTLAELKAVCAAYHKKTVDDLTVNSIDLFLVAANNVRRNKAELLHNFEYARCIANLDIDGVGGASLEDAVFDANYDQFTKIKEVVAVSRMTPQGTYIPIDFARADIPIERDRTTLEFQSLAWLRYPSDAQYARQGWNVSIIQRGRRLEIYPPDIPASNTGNSVALRIECYGLLADYDSDSLEDTEPTDFFVEYGAQFMQWSIINELNFYFKTFVPRTEGNLSPPEQKAADAWRDLLLWDTYLIDANTTRSR